MKIAYLALGEEWQNNSAGHSHSFSICQNLAKLGNDVELFIRGKGKPQAFGRLKVSFINLPKAGGRISGLKELKKLSEKLKNFEIIQERFSVNPLSVLARFGFKGKTILEANDPGVETWTGLRKIAYAPLIRLKLESCDAIITQTETIKKILKAQTKKPVFVISNAAAVKKASKRALEKARKEMKCKNGVVCAIFAGSFREWHGVRLIPKISRLVSGKKIRIVLIGNGELFEKVKSECKSIGNVRFLGAKPFEKIPELLQAADILIAPFVWNNKKFDFWWNPLKLFEYLAAGKPIVTTGFKEVRKIAKNAALYAKPEDIKEFARLLEKLAKNKNLRQRLGKKALQIARENTWEKKASETLKIYKKVLA